MEITYRQFLVNLYEEHLEEASFLYTQRGVLLSDPDIFWPKLQDFETRLEAHVDALIVGGELALNTCRERLLNANADAGELFAIVCVVCRHEEAKLLAEVWRALDFNDIAKVAAVTDALKLEMPLAWQSACEQAITHGDDRLLPILAVVCGARRMPLSEPIAAKLIANPQLVSSQTIAALSRLPLSTSTLKVLEACGKHESGNIKAAALLTLLRGAQRGALKGCYLVAQSEDWPLLALGLAGDRSAAAIVRQRLKSAVVKAETVYALCLLGDLSSVRALCDCLVNEALAEAASWALYWITGAPLFETALVLETVDEGTLFPNELMAWKERGEPPKRADGQPFSNTLHRLTQEVSTWNRWLTEHAGEFDATVRYRRGAAYSLRVVYQCLLDPITPHRLRQLTYEELVIRFGCPVPFEADWQVTQQRVALERMEHWVQQTEAQFASGQW